MAKTKIEVEVDLDDNDSVSKAEGKVKSLKQRLGEMKELLASGTLDEKAFTKLSAEAGQLQDRIADVNQRVKNLASDSQKLDGFVDLAQGIVGGFAAVQGITALVGEENEDLQKTMVKLQAVMTALNGIQAIANALNKDSAAMTAIQTIRLGALATIQRIYTAVTGQATAATRTFTAALVATGIGAILVLIGALVYAMQNFTNATEEQEKALDRLNDQLATNQDYLEGTLELYDQETKLSIIRAKTLGASEETIRSLEAEGRKKRIEELKAFHTESLNEQAAWNVNKYKNAKDAKEANDKLADQVTEAAKKLREAEMADELATEQAKFDSKKEVDEANKVYDDKQDEIRKKRLEERHRLAKEFDERLKKERMDAFQEQLQEQEARVELEKKQAEERLARVVQQRDGELALRRALRERDRLEAEQERKDFEEVWAAKTSIAQSGYSILNSLGELALGQQFKQTAAGKVLAIAQIATDTALAFVSGLRIAQQSAQGTGPGAAFAFPVFYASQAAAILSVAAKAKSILSGGGSAGVGVPSIGNFSSQPPRLDTFTPTSSTSDPIRNLKVYVVEKEMTGAQDRNARIRDNAEIF